MIDIAMMVAGVGMQFFNNYANNKKNEALQAKQREYQIASAEHDFERMRRIQAESAKIALEMEAELHKERMTDINNQYDNLLDNFAHGFSISNWPLNVLPFIMKGESFGSLFNGTYNSINMHCIFTPSNCDWFNENFYDDIDLRLEAEMNNHWNAQSSHPIVYYGGCWNRRTMHRGLSIPDPVDLNDIDLLKVNLKNIPMMVITPYFDPWLHFRFELWGMGKDSAVPFRIDIPHGDIDFENRIFSYDYNKEIEEGIYEEDFQNVTIEEFVPYLECLIGYVADKYFWSMYSIEPSLPLLLKDNSSLLTVGMKQQITNLCKDEIETNILSSNDIKTSVSLLDTLSHIVDSASHVEVAKKHSSKIQSKDFLTIEEMKFLESIKHRYGSVYSHVLEKFQIQEYEEMETIRVVDYDDVLDTIESISKNALGATQFVYCLWNPHVIIGSFCDSDFCECIYEQSNIIHYFAFILKDLQDLNQSAEIKYYTINLTTYNTELIFMNNKQNQKMSFRERLGMRLIKRGQRLANVSIKVNGKDDPWGNSESGKSDEIDEILNFFIHGVSNGTIPFSKFTDNLNVTEFLDWIDSIDDNSIAGANQLYIVKGFNEEANKYIYCAFLANNDHFNLVETEKKCFISSVDNGEMQQLFNGKQVYIIPFEN